jgi:hypothetical protein
MFIWAREGEFDRQGQKEIRRKLRILELNCGHYSLSLPPNVILAGWSILRLLSRSE